MTTPFDQKAPVGQVTLPVSTGPPPRRLKASPQGVVVGAVVVLMIGIIAGLLVTSRGGNRTEEKIDLAPPVMSGHVTVRIPVAPSPSISPSPVPVVTSRTRSTEARIERTPRPDDSEETRRRPRGDSDDVEITVVQGESGDGNGAPADDDTHQSGDNKSGQHVTSCPSSDPRCAQQPGP